MYTPSTARIVVLSTLFVSFLQPTIGFSAEAFCAQSADGPVEAVGKTRFVKIKGPQRPWYEFWPDNSQPRMKARVVLTQPLILEELNSDPIDYVQGMTETLARRLSGYTRLRQAILGSELESSLPSFSYGDIVEYTIGHFNDRDPVDGMPLPMEAVVTLKKIDQPQTLRKLLIAYCHQGSQLYVYSDGEIVGATGSHQAFFHRISRPELQALLQTFANAGYLVLSTGHPFC